MSLNTMYARVYEIRHEAQNIISIDLRPVAPSVEFPPYEAGAHINLHLGNGLVRSYSLCNLDDACDRYVICVQNARNSRGGSRYVHQQLHVGMTLLISIPRNNFKLDESAVHSVLVAGGIGVTPLWCMLQRLSARGLSVEMIYCARNHKEAAFCDEIAALCEDKGLAVTWHFDDQAGGPPRLAELLAGKGAQSHYYCCGPPPMLDNFEKGCNALGYVHVHIERFSAIPFVAPSTTKSFIVDCARSGKAVVVLPGKSILDSLIEAGLCPDYSCKEGVCGSCETRVIEGDIVHRDSVLTESERERGRTMMICVSSCKSPVLILDI